MLIPAVPGRSSLSGSQACSSAPCSSEHRASSTIHFVRVSFGVARVLRTDRNSVLCYMLSPRTCHRFVGHLEEEAVIT